MQIRDVMTKDVWSSGPAATVAEAAQAMRDMNVGSIPLVDGDQLVGVITDRDIVIHIVAEGLDAQTERIESFMTREMVTATPDTSVEEASQIMAREQIRRLPVVEDGRLVGYLAIGDLALLDKDRQVGDALEHISQPFGTL